MPGRQPTRRAPALIAVYLVVLAGFVALPLVADDYWLNILVLGFISSIVVFSLNVLTGYAGLLSFGQAGFVGVGAYAYGVLTVSGVHPLLALLAGVLLALVMGLALGLPAARLKGHYLAIGTLGFGVLIAQALNNMVDVTRGPMGLLGIRSFGWSHHAWYWAGLVISLSLAALLHWIERRTFLGVILKSVKYEEISATASGIAVFAVKLGAFCVSAALAGFAGALFASYVRFLTPDLFNSAESFRYLMMAVVGGAVSASGGWIAALVLTALPEALRGLGESNLRLLVYGATVLCVLWFLPQGVGGVLETWSSRLRRPRRAMGSMGSMGAMGSHRDDGDGSGSGSGSGNVIGSGSGNGQASDRDRPGDKGAAS
jgi:branched-chain amino acid transport system permease protein